MCTSECGCRVVSGHRSNTFLLQLYPEPPVAASLQSLCRFDEAHVHSEISLCSLELQTVPKQLKHPSLKP